MKVVRKKRKFNLKLNKLKINQDSSIDTCQMIDQYNNRKIKKKKLFQIISNLYLSGYNSAKDLDCLNNVGISHVINLTSHKCPNLHTNKVEYSSFALADNVNFNLISVLNQIIKTIQKKIKEGHKILIHCKMGISRAPSVMIAFLMMTKNMKFKNAFDYVQKINPKISPNLGFLMQLQKLEDLTMN